MSTSTKWARFSYPGTPTSFWETMGWARLKLIYSSNRCAPGPPGPGGHGVDVVAVITHINANRMESWKLVEKPFAMKQVEEYTQLGITMLRPLVRHLGAARSEKQDRRTLDSVSSMTKKSESSMF